MSRIVEIIKLFEVLDLGDRGGKTIIRTAYINKQKRRKRKIL